MTHGVEGKRRQSWFGDSAVQDNCKLIGSYRSWFPDIKSRTHLICVRINACVYVRPCEHVSECALVSCVIYYHSLS